MTGRLTEDELGATLGWALRVAQQAGAHVNYAITHPASSDVTLRLADNTPDDTARRLVEELGGDPDTPQVRDTTHTYWEIDVGTPVGVMGPRPTVYRRARDYEKAITSAESTARALLLTIVDTTDCAAYNDAQDQLRNLVAAAQRDGYTVHHDGGFWQVTPANQTQRGGAA